MYVKEAIYRQHGFGPLPMTPLKHFDAFHLTADLYKVPHSKLLRRAGCGLTATGCHS